MGVNFNYFKNYKIVDNFGYGNSIEYIGGDSVSHSYGNRTKLQNVFYQYLKIQIPVIDDNYIDDLIEPSQMSIYCTMLLNNKKYNLNDLEDRIIWIKKLSDEGYYVSYDMS